MLEDVDLNRSLARDEYKASFTNLEARLGVLQRTARAKGLPVIIVLEGWDAAGKGAVINRLAQALDPRGFKVRVVLEPDEAERLRPWMWRFWRQLPAAGSITILDGSWYRKVLSERINGAAGARTLAATFEDILSFERQLANGGALIVKFWLHLGREEQRNRFRELLADPATAWKVGQHELRQNDRYEQWLAAVEDMLACTNTAHCPWTVVPATHGRVRRREVFRTLVERMEGRLGGGDVQEQQRERAGETPAERSVRLDDVDLDVSLKKREYRKRRDELQGQLYALEHQLFLERVPAVVVYEGWDASGKGGNIRRLTAGLDPRGYEVIPVGPPTREESAHHYLWRFWRDIPKAGHIAIFDRSWYGRVLVERIEGFCSADEWQRAFDEINEFERQLVGFGTVVIKFWLHISADEQLRRFRAREQTPQKRWKITADDWHNRARREDYCRAVDQMLERTSTDYAPWTLVPGNCKRYARVAALQTVVDAIRTAVGGE